MSSPIAKQFMNALQQAEQSRDVEPLVALFSGDAELWKINGETERGEAGARRFWERYLSDFETIRSTFGNVIEGEDGVALEWTSEGTLATGRPITYRGVSILEYTVERVGRFRTYYDSAAFLTKGADATV